MEKKKIIRKVCLLGDGGVGKTSLISRYVLDCFSDEYIVSFGTKVSKKVIDFDDVQLTLMIWDILGQNVNRSLHAAYYSGANGALLVCDSTRPETLQHLPEWAEDFRKVVGPRPIVLLANKADLESRLSAGLLGEVTGRLEQDIGFTSARTGEGVQAAFEGLGRRVLEGKG